MTTRTFNWPTREQWAERTRTFYDDQADDARNSVSGRAVDYATPDEVAQAVTELRALWVDLGQQLRATTRAVAHVSLPDPDIDGWDAWFAARDALPAEDRENLERRRELKDRRHYINRLVKTLTNPRDGYLSAFDVHRVGSTTACPTFTAIVGRWQQAQQVAVDGLRARIESRPVDDAAWQRELERRAELERYFRDGPIVGHQRHGGGV